jgi:HSP20 family protein
MPPIAVWATNEETQICVDLPGVARQDVDVSVHGRVIVVTGRRMPQPGHERPRFAEHASGAFRRIIPVPLGARVEQMNASLRDGVLVLRMPNEPAEASQARSINVS